MYRCIYCNTKTQTPSECYDKYDRERYKACPHCGSDLAEPEEYCCLCSSALFGGEKAIQINNKIYCLNCAAEVEI